MKSSKSGMKAGWSFAAGALFGAVVILVPFASAGHTRAARSPQRAEASGTAGSGRSVSASPSGRQTTPEDASRTSPESKRAVESGNQTTCDVQLD